MKYIAEYVLLRSPVGIEYTLDPAKIRSNDLFMNALSIASPQFHETIIKKDVIDERALLSLRKYYNRFCFRPTPFGLFSAVTLIKWGEKNAQSPNEQLLIHTQLDDHFSYQLYTSYFADHHEDFTPNPTVYRVHQEFRFIRTDTDKETGRRQYLLQATDFSMLLKRLLKYCENGSTRKKILQFICREAGCNHDESLDYLTFLIDARVIVPVNRPNITGEEYVRTLTGIYPDCIPPLKRKTVQRLFRSLGKVQPFNQQELVRLQQLIVESLPKKKYYSKSLLNVISLKTGTPFSLTASHRQALEDGLSALERLSIVANDSPLNSFAKQFNKRYEGQSVPLLQVLDPEIGIAYGETEIERDHPLLETLAIAPHNAITDKIRWSPVHQLLLNHWHRPTTNKSLTIQLEEHDLRGINPNDKQRSASGFSVLFRANNSQVWLDAAGGYHTNTLLGRFTPASEAMYQVAKAMAAHDQQLNPDVIFAELAHLSDLHTDNVNRRMAILPFEIPITAAGTVGAKQQLALSDLYVSVVGDKVLLFSRKHKKWVIPRLSSAYNYRLNTLPLFRFLADLPYQFRSEVRPLDLAAYFPGLNFYPRIMYKQAVLSPASWVLRAEEISVLKTADERRACRVFRDLQQKYRLPDVFALTNGDQQLIFDCCAKDQLSFFIASLPAQASAKLSEVIMDETSGRVITHQFNAFAEASESLDLPVGSNAPRSLSRLKRKFMPGSEWLYLKIYTSKLGTDDLLRQLAPYLKRQQRMGLLKKWFFVRYEDHAPHIRLRLLTEAKNIGFILNDLRALFESKVEQQVIREYQLDTYSRELERYPVKSYETIETLFHASSDFVLSYLTYQKANPVAKPYLTAIITIRDLLNEAFDKEMDRLEFCRARYEQFRQEFSAKKTEMELDRKFRSYRPELGAAMADADFFKSAEIKKHHLRHLRSFKLLLTGEGRQHYEKEILISTVMHMHLNRLFVTESRLQEMITFYFLYKYLKSQEALSRFNK